jgi:biopolymer transport protein ExbB/TolQ
MSDTTNSLVQTILGLPIFHSEWVLYLLIALSVISIGVIVERWRFYRRHTVDVDALGAALTQSLDKGDIEAAAALLRRHDSLETNVVLTGLRHYEQGPDSVEDLITGALGEERSRYEKRLQLLATLASNAPSSAGAVFGASRRCFSG